MFSCGVLYKSQNKNKKKTNAFKNKGFTLVELLLTMAIGSIIIMSFSSMLNFTVNSCKIGEMENEFLLNGRYAIEYIKREIKSADKIISSDKISGLNERYTNNFNFIIMTYNPSPEYGYKYNYSTYYFKDNKIYRVSAKRNDNRLPNSWSFSGNNIIVEYVISIEGTEVDFDTKIMNLSFLLGNENGKQLKFNSKVGICCPLLY